MSDGASNGTTVPTAGGTPGPRVRSRFNWVWSLWGGGLMSRGASTGRGGGAPGGRLGLLRRLSLAIFFILHSTILKPNFHLPLRQIKVTSELPSLLFGYVSVVQKLLF